MNGTQHPLVTHYLDDLGRMLNHLPPGDRAEVLAGVHEHIEAGLAERRGATDADVSAVLAELGPPETVAREAYGTEYAVGSPQGAGAAEPVGTRWSDRPWVPVAVAVLQVLALLLLLAAVGGGAAYTTTEVTSSNGESVRTVDYQVGSTVMWVVVSGLWLLPLWIGIAMLVGNSRLWIARHKLVHLLLLPVSALVVGLIPDLGWILAGERGLNIASVAGLVLIVGVGGWQMVRLTRAGRASSHS